MNTDEIHDIHEQIEIYKIAVHFGIVRMLDYFEDSDNIYICFEKHLNVVKR